MMGMFDAIKSFLDQLQAESPSKGPQDLPEPEIDSPFLYDGKVTLVIPGDEEIRVPVHIAHLYVPRETANYGGGDHVMLDGSFEVGRIKRKRGDTLCLWRPHRKHRGGAFYPVGATRKPRCKRCVEVLHRLGASLEVIVGVKP